MRLVWYVNTEFLIAPMLAAATAAPMQAEAAHMPAETHAQAGPHEHGMSTLDRANTHIDSSEALRRHRVPWIWNTSAWRQSLVRTA